MNIDRTNPSASNEPQADAARLLHQADRYLSGLQAYQLTNEDASQKLITAMEGARRQKLAERPDSLLSILLLGASGAGKSELLNALAGERIARSHHARPTTTRPTIYAHEEVAAERLFEFGTTLGNLATDPAAIVRHNRPELRQKILIDAPDIDSFRTGHRQIVLELLPAVDVVLYVVTGWTYRDDIGWRTVLEGRGHRAVGFVMNKWDREGRPPRKPGLVDVDEDFLNLLETGGWTNPILFRTSSAYWATRRSETQPETQGMTFLNGAVPEGDQFPELQKWLADGLSSSEIAQIQRRKRRGLWGELAAAVAQSRPKIGNAEQFLEWTDNQLLSMRKQSLAMLKPGIEEAVRQNSDRQRQEEIPDTPGPYGQARRFMRNVVLALTGLKHTMTPWGTPSSLGHPSSQFPSVSSETGQTEFVASSMQRGLSEIVWQARQDGIPATWLENQWDGTGQRLSRRLTDAMHLVLARPTIQREPWRRFTVRYIAWGLDILLLIAVAATAYRLTVGLLLGNAASAGYVLSFLTLLVCAMILGNTAIALLLPDQTAGLTRSLERAAEQAAATTLSEIAQTAKGYMEDLANLDRVARELEQGINQQISLLQQDIAKAADRPRQAPDITERLFATANT